MDGPGTILVVDDEETFRESTCRLLQRDGFLCVCAANGDEAVKALQDRRFDLVIADIRMSGNADLRVVRAANECDVPTPVILVTGYPSADTAIRAISLSVSAYMTKPVDFDELLGHVRLAVARSRTRRAVATVCARLRSCISDLEAVPSEAACDSARGGMVSLGTIRTLAACLSDLLRLGAGPDAGRGPASLCELLDCPQQPAHRQAIVHAIAVLKRTKDAFKSKSLAELRTYLEDLLGPGEGSGCHR
jgi:CheY-like chemotaxis protein